MVTFLLIFIDHSQKKFAFDKQQIILMTTSTIEISFVNGKVEFKRKKKSENDIVLTPKQQRCRYQYQQFQTNRLRYVQDVVEFQKILVKKPNSIFLLEQLCQKCEQAGLYKKSCFYFNQITKLDPKNLRNYLRRSLYLISVRKYQQAQQLIKGKKRIKANDLAYIYQIAADQLMEQDENQKAISYLKKTTKLDTRNEYVLYTLARAYCFVGDLSGSIKCIEKCLNLNKDKIQFHLLRSMVQLKMIMTNEALEYDSSEDKIKQIVKTTNVSYQCFFYLAQIERMKFNYEQAKNFYSMYQRGQCKYYWEKQSTIRGLIICLNYAKQYEQLLVIIPQIFSISRSNQKICLIQTGIVLCELGRKQEAQEYLKLRQKYIQRPYFQEYMGLYFCLCNKLNKVDQCVKVYEEYGKFIESNNFWASYYALQAFMQLQLKKKATDIIKKLMNSQINLGLYAHEPAYYQLMKICIDLGLVKEVNNMIKISKQITSKNYYNTEVIQHVKQAINQLKQERN